MVLILINFLFQIMMPLDHRLTKLRNRRYVFHGGVSRERMPACVQTRTCACRYILTSYCLNCPVIGAYLLKVNLFIISCALLENAVVFRK